MLDVTHFNNQSKTVNCTVQRRDIYSHTQILVLTARLRQPPAVWLGRC